MKNEIVSKDPYVLFDKWFNQAEEKEVDYPSAMALSAVNEDGKPTVRIVLMRGIDNRGFRFFTNYNSAKGRALIANPYAEASFYWKSTQKQIRIAGSVEKLSVEESDEYFNNRPRNSRIGAWASKQSQIMENGYEELEKFVNEFDDKFEGIENPPRPEHWGGFRIVPERMEFWEEQPYRLHKRFVYTRKDIKDDWNIDWLYP